MAEIVAYRVRADGVPEVLGVDVGVSEDVAFWRDLMPGLIARGLRGVQLVISDAHNGLQQAIREVIVGASWQRCLVPCLRNVRAAVPKQTQSMIAATVRMVFEHADRAAA